MKMITNLLITFNHGVAIPASLDACHLTCAMYINHGQTLSNSR